MKDKLEQFISGHSNELDVHEPPAGIWLGIDSKLRQNRRSKFIKLGIAACAVLAMGAAISYMALPAKQQKNEPDAIAIQLPQEINKTEVYYTSLIQKQQKQLSVYCSDYQDVCKDFRTEIDTLDVLYRQLKVEYVNSDNNEAVLRAMIENLQEQVKLLSLQLKIIEEAKQKNKETRHFI